MFSDHLANAYERKICPVFSWLHCKDDLKSRVIFFCSIFVTPFLVRISSFIRYANNTLHFIMCVYMRLLISYSNTAVKRLRMRVVRRRSRRTSTDDDDSTSLPMVVDCSDTSLVGILHNFHCEHCCLLCFLALVLDCDNNSCKDI